MKNLLNIIQDTIIEFNDSGRTSSTALSRNIIGKLSEEGFQIVKSSEWQINDSSKLTDDIYLFKVRDYTATLLGRYDSVGNYFYVQRGDGQMYRYDAYRIEWKQKLEIAKQDV